MTNESFCSYYKMTEEGRILFSLILNKMLITDALIVPLLVPRPFLFMFLKDAVDELKTLFTAYMFMHQVQ